jgi:hypothetical protein
MRNGLKDISKGSKTSDKQMDELFHYFLYCLQPAIRSKIRIFSLESDHDLDDTIFEAIIQGMLDDAKILFFECILCSKTKGKF